VAEPTTGSDMTKLKTRAVRRGNHYVINGQRVWTSRARHSDLMLLPARTTPVDEVKRRTDEPSVQSA
jgi:acyl-CoA dehydrogenase